MQDFLDAVAAQVAVIDRQGRIVSANAPWQAFFASPPSQDVGLIGESYFEICARRCVGLVPEEAEQIRAGIQAVAEGRQAEFTTKYRCSTCTPPLWFMVTARPFSGADGIEGAVITHVDVTQLKESEARAREMEQALAEHRVLLEDEVFRRTAELSKALEAARVADRTKDEFLANITHELRTPLSAVIGFSRLARPLCAEPRQGEYLDSVIEAGKTLGNIIDDLLDLSKIVAGAVTFDNKPFSIRRLVTRVLSVISFRVSEKGLALRETVAPEVPDVLVGDALRVEQILLNLLGNAVKFTSRGHIHVTINLIERTDQRVCLDLSVEDTGIGIDPEAIPLLFKPFSQADASVTRRFGGTGLGLAICARLATLMAGGVSVHSTPGVGSRFDVRLWLDIGNTQALEPAEEVAINPQAIRYHDTRVLVVDDQSMNRELVEILLNNVGIATDTARNGEQALNLLFDPGKRYDLVMMDIQMPVMDGLTAAGEIRKRPRLKELPIIAMTAHTMVHERERILNTGMNDHLGKPFDEFTLYRVLSHWISPEKQTVQTATGPDAPAGAAATPGFVEIPGIDLVQVRSLMRNNADRFHYWLRDFLDYGPLSVKYIEQALADQDRETASITAHTLKGRSGMLGMTAIHQAVSLLEQAIDRGEAVDPLLINIRNHISQMCENIRQHTPDPIKPSLPENAP